MMSAEKYSFLKEDNGDDNSSKHSVDYYYIEAMKYLSCSDHHSDDSDCSCRRCRKVDDDNSNDGTDNKEQDSLHDSFTSFDDDQINGRERSWSHSMADDYETGTLSNLPNLEGKVVGGRLKNRRYSDGMLLKPNIKLALGNGNNNGRVQWADDCKKELTRCRPRKKYQRNPTLKPAPVKSILKHSSEESLPVNECSDSDT